MRSVVCEGKEQEWTDTRFTSVVAMVAMGWRRFTWSRKDGRGE